MDGRKSRREFLTTAAAAGAVSLASPRLPRAFAQASAGPGPAYLNARQQVAALAARQISAVELLDSAIKRVEAFDGKLNAVVVRDFERARVAAAEADAALARGARLPLLGLPMTVKESFNVAGLPTTWGIPRGKDWRPPEDALTVQRLKAAGAIIFGKTNVPLVLGDWQSFNEIYGTTNNPWDVTRTPGGSSGGSAAALAAGFTALELGSDIGGSLRAPAHYCGVFAHKPSQGLVPGRGQTPPGVRPLPVQINLATVGPMARSTADLGLMLDLIAGPDELIGHAYRLVLPPSRRDDLKSFRVLVLDSYPQLPTAGSVRTAIDRLAERLARAGATVARTSPLLPNLVLAAQTYMQLLSGTFAVDMPIETYRRLQGIAASLPAEDTSLSAMRVRGSVMSYRDMIAAERIRGGIMQQWRDLFREWDVLVCPAMPTLAFPHDHSPQSARKIEIDGQRYPYDDQLVWPGVATLPGLPATAVPVDRSETGLPIGVQIVGPYLEDRTPLRLAELIEQEFGGFTPPPGFG